MKKITSLILVVLMVIGSTAAFAAPFDLHNLKDVAKSYSWDQFVDITDNFDYVAEHLGDYVIEAENGDKFLASQVDAATKDGKSFEEAIKDLEPYTPTEGELTVVEVSAINSTTIKVTFDNGDVENFTVAPLTNGENTRTIVYNGGSYTVTVNFSDVDKAEVESVVLNNYRRMTVTFNTVVNEVSATNPENYYFELVDGLAGKLGAPGDVTKDNTLADIKTTQTGEPNAGWWGTAAARTNITATREAGKTVVTINLPEDARFDNGLTVKDMVTSGTADKVLRQGVSFNFAVRDIKDAEAKRSIDTFVDQLTVEDTVKPTLVKATIVHSDNKTTVADLSKTVDVKVDDKIVLEFSEPLEAHATVGKEVNVYRDGKALDLTAATKAIAIEKAATTTYADAKLATIDLNSTDGFLKDKTPTKGDTFVVLLTGIRDLAGNIIQEAINFNIKVVEDEPSTPGETPDALKILGVEQVLDNVLRIEANQAATLTKTVNVVIKEANEQKQDVVVDLATGLAFTQNATDKKYYAYVAFPAIYKADGVVGGSSTDDKMVDFKGGFYLSKTVVVESNDATKEFATFTKENMHLELDRQAPILDKDQIDIAYDEASSSDLNLVIGFTDKNPTTWKTDSTVKAVQEKIFTNLANGYIASVVEGIRVKTSYINENDDEVNRYVDVDYVAAAAAGKAHIDANNNLVINLTGTNLLVDKDGTELTNLQELKKGATFEVSIPKGVASDDYFEVDTGLTVKTGATNSAVAKFLEKSGRANVAYDAGPPVVNEDKHGYTSVAANVIITIGEDVDAPTTGPDNKVPQTSKKLIAYDKNTDELVILVTGLPTKDSVEDTSNYVLNGKTLKAWGVTKSDILFADAKDADVELVSGESRADATTAGYLATDKYKTIRITLPEGSIKKDGPADLTVRGLKHKDLGMMAEVTLVVEGLKDNTAPSYVSGKIEGSNKLFLRFDEPVVLVEDALPTSAIRNFKVKINGELVSILSVNASENVLEIEIANDNTVIEKAEIEIVMNNNGKMEIADGVGNELKVTITPIVINK